MNNITHNQTEGAGRTSVQRLAMIGVMTAVTCILAPLSLPIGPVPISLTPLIIYLSLYILGTKNTFVSYLIYLLLGLVGVPVFSGFSGGAGRLFGPTGGYLIGFLPMILIAGILISKSCGKIYLEFGAMLAGLVFCYIFGTFWLSYQAHMNFQTALFVGVIPFIAGDVLKILLVLFTAPVVRKRLFKAQILRK